MGMESQPSRIFVGDQEGNIEEKNKMEHETQVRKENDPVKKKLEELTGRPVTSRRKIPKENK